MLFTVFHLSVCFNTQPPEGGWTATATAKFNLSKFQHTATRRWLDFISLYIGGVKFVSTHSHPKVAGGKNRPSYRRQIVSTHSHPKVAGQRGSNDNAAIVVSTHSHPKVAGLSVPIK